MDSYKNTKLFYKVELYWLEAPAWVGKGKSSIFRRYMKDDSSKISQVVLVKIVQAIWRKSSKYPARNIGGEVINGKKDPNQVITMGYCWQREIQDYQ